MSGNPFQTPPQPIQALDGPPPVVRDTQVLQPRALNFDQGAYRSVQVTPQAPPRPDAESHSPEMVPTELQMEDTRAFQFFTPPHRRVFDWEVYFTDTEYGPESVRMNGAMVVEDTFTLEGEPYIPFVDEDRVLRARRAPTVIIGGETFYNVPIMDYGMNRLQVATYFTREDWDDYNDAYRYVFNDGDDSDDDESNAEETLDDDDN